jgi:hypothetical protein
MMKENVLDSIKKLYSDNEEIRIVLEGFGQLNNYYTKSLEAMGLIQQLSLGIGNTATTVQVSGSVNNTDK